MASALVKPKRKKRKSDSMSKDEESQEKSIISVIEKKNIKQSELTIRLSFSVFNVDCELLARNLLGQYLVRFVDGHRISGKIVETEAYLGLEDKAAHSYKGKRSDRNEAMFMAPGTAYVYNIYGMYCCLNISSQGEGCAVLIRALEPQEGLATMKSLRSKNTSNSTKELKDKELTNGPSKLCQALAISKNELNKIDLCTSSLMWLEQGEAIPGQQIVSSARINIGYAEEWQEKPLRFYVLNNPCVSKRNKQAESLNLK